MNAHYLSFPRLFEVNLDVYRISIERVKHVLHDKELIVRDLICNAVKQFLLRSKILIELVVLPVITVQPDLDLGRLINGR